MRDNYTGEELQREATCSTCHGDGEVKINRTSDPQQAEDGPCSDCNGTGISKDHRKFVAAMKDLEKSS